MTNCDLRAREITQVHMKGIIYVKLHNIIMTKKNTKKTMKNKTNQYDDSCVTKNFFFSKIKLFKQTISKKVFFLYDDFSMMNK